MMYSDYYALSSCAISVVFIPFMIVCLLRYGLVLQTCNYNNRAYLRWLGCSFLASWAPLLFISILAMLAEVTLNTYLLHTEATEMMIIVGYALWLLLACAVIALSFGRFARVLGGACWNVPRIEDGRLVLVYTVSGFIAGSLTLLFNIFGQQTILYFMPIFTPLLPALVNALRKPYPGPVTPREGSGSFDDEDLDGASDYNFVHDSRFDETIVRLSPEEMEQIAKHSYKKSDD